MQDLTERERLVLDLAKRFENRSRAALAAAAHEELDGISAVRYYQELRAVVAKPAALALEPVLVNRLQRQQAQARRRRASHRADARSR